MFLERMFTFHTLISTIDILPGLLCRESSAAPGGTGSPARESTFKILEKPQKTLKKHRTTTKNVPKSLKNGTKLAQTARTCGLVPSCSAMLGPAPSPHWYSDRAQMKRGLKPIN